MGKTDGVICSTVSSVLGGRSERRGARPVAGSCPAPARAAAGVGEAPPGGGGGGGGRPRGEGGAGGAPGGGGGGGAPPGGEGGGGAPPRGKGGARGGGRRAARHSVPFHFQLHLVAGLQPQA